MKTLVITSLSLIYLLGIFYLSLPNPIYPDLSSGSLSNEPGDTWQNPGQKAFFSDQTRQDVLQDLQNSFSLSFLGKSLPSFRLNYRPEEATPYVREQIESYYLEEIIHPLRESLFVNGWEPQNAPYWQNVEPEDRPRIQINGIYYNAKITLKPTYSSVLSRILIWSLIFPAGYFTFTSINKTLFTKT
jgi:hypothetical protein